MLDITKCLTVSTAHVKPATMVQLALEKCRNKMGLVVYDKGEYGFWVYISPEDIDEDIPCNRIPQDLMACISLARNNNCEWLCLDSGAEIVDELPNYEEEWT